MRATERRSGLAHERGVATEQVGEGAAALAVEVRLCELADGVRRELRRQLGELGGLGVAACALVVLAGSTAVHRARLARCAEAELRLAQAPQRGAAAARGQGPLGLEVKPRGAEPLHCSLHPVRRVEAAHVAVELAAFAVAVLDEAVRVRHPAQLHARHVAATRRAARRDREVRNEALEARERDARARDVVEQQRAAGAVGREPGRVGGFRARIGRIGRH